ncbi:MAG TPA: carboxypeptidase regulatory-like domain-containing protein [Acidobacteriaceae bacterium]|nr:carboxypeptidase regulatory-like domain-containing protein [Acidobacteriaceae bacterium]
MCGRAVVRQKPSRLLFFVVLALSVSSAAFSQAGRGSVSGLVTDSSGAVIPGATITIENYATGLKQNTVTTAGGLYSFVSLAPGSYRVTATENGFQTLIQDHVLVSVDQSTLINLTMKVGSVSQVVTVNAAADILDTSNSTVGQLIDSAAIDRVPLLNRDVYELVQLSAGVIPANGTPNSGELPTVFNARSLIDVSSYTINGALQGNVYYMVDGSPIGIPENNLATILPAMQIPEDAVDEYRVETQNAPASYQSGAAGVISLVTKSGENQFHGDGFVYIRPNTLAANDYFAKQYDASQGLPNQPADFHRYQVGGSIGGPIRKNKLFFFGDYQATWQESLETDQYTFPTQAERTGDFSADSFTVYNPFVPDTSAGTRQPFPNNNVQGYIDPAAQKMAQYFPLPNQPGEGTYHQLNYNFNGLDPNNGQQFDVRVDYDPSQKQRIFGRFSYGHLYFGNALAFGPNNDWDPNTYRNTTPEFNALVADDYTINPHSVLQLRYSFTRQHEIQVDPGQSGFSLTQFGFPAALQAQVDYPTLPFIGFGAGTSGYTSSIGSGDQGGWYFLFASESSDASATWRTVIGKHELSVGGEYQKMFLNEGFPGASAGAYYFDDSATSSTAFAGDGYDFASYLIGMGEPPGYESGNFSKDIFTAESNPYYGAFVSDNYHLTKSLDVSLGLRWDIFGGRTERHNRLEYFDPNLNYSVNGVALTGGEVFAGVGGASRTPFTTNLTDLSPRLSFAWQAQPRLVFHGGAGIYYGPSTHMVAGPGEDSQGFSSLTSWNSTAYNADGNTVMVNPLSNPFPAGIVQPTGSSLGPATGIGAPLTSALHSQSEPTVYDYNFGYEVQLPGSIALNVAYVGSHGLYLAMNGQDLNELPLSVYANYQNALNNNIPNTWEAALPSTSAFYGASTVPMWLGLEPYPQYSNGGPNSGVAVDGNPVGSSVYNSLQTKIEKRFSNHWTTLASYTWGKIMTNDTAPPLSFVGYHGNGAPQDWRDLNLERSVSPQDVTYQFNWQTSWDLPAGKGRALNLSGVPNGIFGNWTINTIVYLSSGQPIAVPNGTADPWFNQRVDETCNPAAGAPHTASMWFNYTCFSQPANPFLPGRSPAYLSNVRTNGAHDLDVSLYKNFPMGEQRNLRFEIAAYNITNSVQLGYPNVFWNPDPSPANMAGFGQVTGDSNQPRQFQVASRFSF